MDSVFSKSTLEAIKHNQELSVKFKKTIDDYKKGFSEMSEWISVDDRLPNLHENVFICALNDDNDRYYANAYFNPNNKFLMIGGRNAKRVTHWMQISAPPCSQDCSR